MSRLSGKRAVVTGGGSGIGRATCRRFAAEGAAVVVADLLGERAEEVAAEIGGSAVQADVTVAADVARLVEAAGRIDVLVNNAGGGFADDVLEISEEEWDGDVTLNLKSAFLCSKAVLPGMIEQGSGVIVNISSVNGIAFFANEPYSAAKAGLISLTRSMAVRYGKHGIRVVAIAPGTIRSPHLAGARGQGAGDLRAARSLVPAGPGGGARGRGERGRLPRLRRRVVDQRRRAPGRRRPARRQRADGARARRQLLARRRG